VGSKDDEEEDEQKEKFCWARARPACGRLVLGTEFERDLESLDEIKSLHRQITALAAHMAKVMS
jgi:hypothetical protein